MNKKTMWYLAGAVIGLNVLAMGYLVLRQPSTKTDSPQSSYPLLSPRIFADNPNQVLLNFVPLRKKLEAKFDALPVDTKYSFYFEYLPSGTSVRIGDNNELVAASLIKVPLVMNLYRAAEMGKIDLDQEVALQENELDNAYGDVWQKGAGARFTLRELARLALEKSDNTATHAIYNHTKDLLQEEDQSLAQLDIDQNMQDGQAIINAKSYTSVLKSLYLASYINRQNSNELLSYLTQSTEHNRLTKNLPPTTKVAHKNGVYNQSWSESDCGIVYATKRPYAVCIMLGLPEDQADTFIAEVSKMIFDYISTQK